MFVKAQQLEGEAERSACAKLQQEFGTAGRTAAEELAKEKAASRAML